MNKYRVTLIDNQIQSIEPTEQDIPTNDTILEERTGSTLYVFLHAESEAEAREKAGRLSNRLGGGTPLPPADNE